jgi:hypothetical protein
MRIEAPIGVRGKHLCPNMYPFATITLTPENSKGVAKLAALIGWTPDQLANHLLAETLEEFADAISGSLECFLGAIYYPDRASAQRALDRVTQMTRASFGGRLPEHRLSRAGFSTNFLGESFAESAIGSEPVFSDQFL